MAEAMKLAVRAGRLAYLAGRIPRKLYASASSPVEGLVGRSADQPLEDLLARLERERLEADRLYNEALTAVDGAIQEAPALPDPPRPTTTRG